MIKSLREAFYLAVCCTTAAASEIAAGTVSLTTETNREDLVAVSESLKDVRAVPPVRSNFKWGAPQPSLVPNKIDPAPDYFCTWNVQGYACSYRSSAAQRAEMTETNLFGDGPYQGWVNFFPKIRGDLIFVMDDSWDVPMDGDESYFGSLILNHERFPSFQGPPGKRLENLVKRIKAAGWKGAGGWVCAQQAPKYGNVKEQAYWDERFGWMRQAGFAYWKVDWGKNAQNVGWRKMLTELGQRDDPHLYIEHALTKDAINFASVYRTYDVENVIAAPVTIDRVADLLARSPRTSPTIINCEDEPYIAAGLGCAIGIMRHPFAGVLPNGRQDMVFPPVGRDLKRRLDEVARVVRWHKIAGPIPLGLTSACVDTNQFTDTWQLEPNETWTSFRPGDKRTASAPARVARGLDLPVVQTQEDEMAPFVLASRYPNGAIAIATIGRTQRREYVNPKANVTVAVGNASGPFGVFGYFDSLVLRFDHPLGKVRVLGQDLNANESVDVTAYVSVQGGELRIPGTLISSLGLSGSSPGDLSEPGLVLAIISSP